MDTENQIRAYPGAASARNIPHLVCAEPPPSTNATVWSGPILRGSSDTVPARDRSVGNDRGSSLGRGRPKLTGRAAWADRTLWMISGSQSTPPSGGPSGAGAIEGIGRAHV